MTDDPDRQKRSAVRERFEELASDRSEHEASWRNIAQWMMPRRSFTIERAKNQLARRRIADMTAPTAGERLAQLLHGYLMDSHDPWIEPVLRAGKASERDQRWFGHVQSEMHRYLQSPRSTFRGALMESVTDDVFFGNSVVWPGATTPGAPPIFKSLPLFECYWRDDDDGRTDTLYRRFKLSLKNAARQFPTPKLAEKLKRAKPDLSEEFTFIQAVEPRPFGVAGAPGPGKPFTSILYNLDTDEIAKEGGFDSFPFAVTRLQRQSGDTYGTGIGWKALPLHILMCQMVEAIAQSANYAATPPLLDLTGRIEKLDLRPLAFNKMNAAEAMLLDPSQIIQKIYEGGDTSQANALLGYIKRQIEFMFFVDWMARQDGQPISATQVNDDRDIRLRSLTGVVARAEQEKMTPLSERTFEAMQKADMFLPAPDGLAGKDIDFVYTSPLSIAQKKSRLEAIANGMNLIANLAQLDPDVIDIPDTDLLARDGMIAAGLPLKLQRSETTTADRRQKRAAAQDQMRQLEAAQMAAGAARDGGQALASLNNAEAA